MNLTDETPYQVRVEMTPIMDVVFLLLVFFIYAFMTMTVQRGIKVDLPRAEGAINTQQNIRIVLTATNEMLLDGRTAMSQEAIVEAATLRHKTLDLPVVISADRQAHAGPTLELLAALRANGIDKVTYQVEKQK